jgi:transcriptional regulator GlxA family with amidase domain
VQILNTRSDVLAETGLLDGLEATGHWAYRNIFKKHYPQIKWRENPVLNLTAGQKRLITTGGATSW